jgi:SagB-type dehydrogenase family enzyme
MSSAPGLAPERSRAEGAAPGFELTLDAYEVNPELIVSFEQASVRLTVPAQHRVLRCAPGVLRVLGAFNDQSGEELATLHEEFTSESLRDVFGILEGHRVIVRRREAPTFAEAWEEWGEPAWFFHLMTQNTRFAQCESEHIHLAASTLAGPPPPPRYKCLCGTAAFALRLPQPDRLGRWDVSELLVSRRTCREFSGAALSLNEVANLLFYTGGVLCEHDTIAFGTVLKKCAPSPGARHGTELYPVILNCEGAEPGLYHYCVEHHALAAIADIDTKQFLRAALVNQEYFENASMTVFFTCVVARLQWKYKVPRIYRLAHLEVGHYCQNFLLAATALRRGAFCTGALGDSVIEAALGVDGRQEFVLYAAGAGHAAPDNGVDRPQARVSSRLPAGLTVQPR